jgi:hypothetical protein
VERCSCSTFCILALTLILYWRLQTALVFSFGKLPPSAFLSRICTTWKNTSYQSFSITNDHHWYMFHRKRSNRYSKSVGTRCRTIGPPFCKSGLNWRASLANTAHLLHIKVVAFLFDVNRREANHQQRGMVAVLKVWWKMLLVIENIVSNTAQKRPANGPSPSQRQTYPTHPDRRSGFRTLFSTNQTGPAFTSASMMMKVKKANCSFVCSLWKHNFVCLKIFEYIFTYCN